MGTWFASSISTAREARAASEELLGSLDPRGPADLVLLFSSAHFEDDLEGVISRIRAAFPDAVILGCTAQSTLGCDRELENTPAMSLFAAGLPDVAIRPFHFTQKQLEAATSQFDWERAVGVSPESDPLFVALGDPFSTDIQAFVTRINDLFPSAPLVGGVASAGSAPGENRLIVGEAIHREGIVGVALTGRLAVDTVVSPGCRPIGKSFVITKGERNVIQELGGHTALKQLHGVLTDLPEHDEALAKQSLLVGRLIDEHKAVSDRANVLIHNIIGVDRVHGAIGIAGPARVGATVQFQVRDAASADADLRSMLAPHADRNVRGALLFGCNGRGTQMWPQSGHDVGVLRELLGDVPLAGCFCAGEFGPVGGRNYIHGFTASIALFRDPEDG